MNNKYDIGIDNINFHPVSFDQVKELKEKQKKNPKKNKMKCDSCKNKKGEILQRDESGGGSFFEYCSKGHWEGSGLQDENLEWENCPDFERDIRNTGIKIINDHGKRLYVNAHGYIHCHHNRDPLIEVVTSFGNKSFICNQCGEVVKRELTPTSL